MIVHAVLLHFLGRLGQNSQLALCQWHLKIRFQQVDHYICSDRLDAARSVG